MLPAGAAVDIRYRYGHVNFSAGPIGKDLQRRSRSLRSPCALGERTTIGIIRARASFCSQSWAEIPPVPSGLRTIPNSPYLRAIPPRVQAVPAHGFDPVFDPLGSKLW